MTDHPAEVELRDYRSTVPNFYVALAWLWLAIPFSYGVFELIIKVKQLFE